MPELKVGPFTYETRKLVESGLNIEINQVWTYREMSDLLGMEVAGSTPSLQAALKRLSRDHGCEFKNLRNIGYLRLDDVGIVEMSTPDRQSIRNRVARSIQRTTNIRKWEELSDHYKRELDAHRSVVSLMRQILKPSSMKQIRAEVERARDTIDLEQTLELFKPKAKK
jgi:hypothetical protein